MVLRYEKPHSLLAKTNGPRFNSVSVLFDMERTDAFEEMLLNCGREGDAERIEALLQRCPSLDINTRDRRNGNTPLMWAASRGHCKVLEILLAHGADPTLVNAQKQTVLDMASPTVQKNILVNASGGRKVSNQKLLQAAWMGNYSQVKRLLAQNKTNIQVNCTNSDGLTPLLLVARDLPLLERNSELLPSFQPADVANLLLQFGAEFQVAEGQTGLTALHMACGSVSKHGVDLVETLLRHGADVSVRDRYEFTPLHCAAKVGSTGAVRALINHSGKDVKLDVQGSAGSTPLHLSAMGGHEETIKLLLKAGANVKCTDDSGQTPVETAKTRRTKAILQGKTPPSQEQSSSESQKRTAPLGPVRTPSRLSRAKSFGGLKDLTLPVASLGLQESYQRPGGDVARSPSDGSLELFQHPFFMSSGCGTPAKNVRPVISHANTQLSLAELSASAPLAIAPSRPDSGLSHLGTRNSQLRRSTPARTTRVHLPPVLNSKSPAPALFINRQDDPDPQSLGSDPLMICGRASTRTFVEDLEDSVGMPSAMIPASPVQVSHSYGDDIDIPDTITEADIESARSSGIARNPKRSNDFLPGPVIQIPRRQLKPLQSERRRSVKFSDEKDALDVRRSLELGSPRLEKKHQRKYSCPDVEADLKNELEHQSSEIPPTEEKCEKKVSIADNVKRKPTEQTLESTLGSSQVNVESSNHRSPRESNAVKSQSNMKKNTVAKMKGPLVAAKPQRTAIKMSSIKGHSIALSDKQKVDRLKRVAAQPAPEPHSAVVQPTMMKPVRPRRASKERESSEAIEKKQVTDISGTVAPPTPVSETAKNVEITQVKKNATIEVCEVKTVEKSEVNKIVAKSKVRSSESVPRQTNKEPNKSSGQQSRVIVSSPVKSVNKRKVSAPSGRRRNIGKKKGLHSCEDRSSSPPVPSPEDGTALISGIGWHVHTTANPDIPVASSSPVYGSPRSTIFASKYPVIGKIVSQDNLLSRGEEEQQEEHNIGPFRRGPIDIATASIPYIEPSSHRMGEDDPTPRNQFLDDRELSEVALDHVQEVMPPNQEEASLCPPSLQELDELTEIEAPVFDDDDDELPFQPSDSEVEEGDGFSDLEDDDVASNAAWHRRVEATDYLDLLRKCSRAEFVRGDRTAPTPASASKSPTELMTEGQFEQSWQRDSLRSTFSTQADTLKSNVSEISSVTGIGGNQQLGETIDWKRGNLLGRGAFGRVFCGMTARGELIAVKQMELSPDDRAQEEVHKIQDEIELLKTLRHRNIVQFYGTSRTNNVVNIFMEYLPGGSIASLLNRFGVFEESVFCRYTRQILDGVSFLHSMNIVHRDIKGANLMLMPNGRIKLIDFGCAKRLAQQTSQQQLQNSMQGSPYWMAPEVIRETGHGPKSDCWSIGCTVFEMATTKPPWAHMQPYAAIFAIGSGVGPIPALDHEKFSPAACKFVSRCLSRDPSERPSAQELLEDPFVAKRSHSRKNTIISDEKET